ncbi:orotidine-5'-phosphate decarboxylase [Nocardioides alcanivorans]|uniref:orotidine-5'-phosphate decarboxylase n=1 Tax=Nocardioides alcanivorans TaxID=2897352 RepID=UPI004067B5F4
MTSFGSRLHAAVRTRGPLCVGIDPHASLLSAWGIAHDVAGLERFSLTVVEALADRVSVLKPQSAFYERFGSRGVAVLERTIAEARSAGALVLLDIKRGDIGSTSQAYADAYLDATSPLFSDAVTVSPYLGFGSVQPMLDTARANDAGVFVLALTSNPEGPQFQHATTATGRSVGGTVLDSLAELNAGAEPLGSFGAVVGATIGEVGRASTSTVRSSLPAWERRVAHPTTYAACSAPLLPTCCPRPRVRCWGPDPPLPHCVRRPLGATNSSPAWCDEPDGRLRTAPGRGSRGPGCPGGLGPHRMPTERAGTPGRLLQGDRRRLGDLDAHC